MRNRLTLSVRGVDERRSLSYGSVREVASQRGAAFRGCARFPGAVRFLGLGQLPAEALRMLWGKPPAGDGSDARPREPCVGRHEVRGSPAFCCDRTTEKRGADGPAWRCVSTCTGVTITRHTCSAAWRPYPSPHSCARASNRTSLALTISSQSQAPGTP